MRVVRHHDPRTKTIEVPLGVSDEYGLGDQIGDPGILKPSWSQRCDIQVAAIKNTIPIRESVAGGEAHGGFGGIGGIRFGW